MFKGIFFTVSLSALFVISYYCLIINGFIKFSLYFIVGFVGSIYLKKGILWILNRKEIKKANEEIDRQLREEREHKERVLVAFKRH